MADVESIHREMLAEIDNSYQKTPGFPAFDFTRAFALATASLGGDVETAESRLDPDNLTGEDLDEYVWKHRGLSRRYATYAEAQLRVTAGSGTVQEGTLFATPTGVQFYAAETVEAETGTTFGARAVEAGAGGNVPAGAITVMPVTIPGIGGITNDEAASGGYDEESDGALRDRYYDVMRNPSNGGNIAAYRAWAMSVAGVGRATVFPAPEGPNTVEVCLVDASGNPADGDLLDEVQELIDPNHNGDGEGEAPIGAVCTVTAPSPLDVDVEVTVSLSAGTEPEEVQAEIAARLDAAVRSAALAGITLRYAAMAEAVLAEGVEDYSGLLVNGAAASIVYGSRQVPVLGEAVITVAGS